MSGGLPWQGDPLGWNLALAAGSCLVVFLATFGVALVKGVHRVVDIAWGLAFTAVAVTSYGLSAVLPAGDGDDTRRLLLTVLTAVWGLRLSAHIGVRGRGRGEDPRYARMLRGSSGSPDSSGSPGSPALYALRVVYLLQAGLAWVVSLPVQVGQYVDRPAGVLTWLGVAVWAVGLLFEAVGDHQLARFKADPANRGRIMDRGLWAWTRHPNYFGDFCVWWGLFLIAAGHWTIAAMTVIAPLLMSWLLIRGSGKRLLERHLADRPGYQEYAARTSGFLPLPPRRGA